MSFFGALGSLQQSSVQKRKVVLVISVAILMVFIIALWMVQLRILNTPQDEISDTPSPAGPFGVIWEATRDNMKDLRRSFYGSN